MTRLIAVLIALLFGGVFISAHAETQGATFTKVWSKYGQTYGSPQEYCSYQLGQAANPCGFSVSAREMSVDYYACDLTGGDPNVGGCSAQILQWDTISASSSYTCPTTGGWVLQPPSTCYRPDCPSGTVHNDAGQCVADCPPAGSSAMIGGAAAWGVNGGSAGCTSGFGFNGCGISCTGGASSGGRASCTGCSFTGEGYDSNGAQGVPVPASEANAASTPDGCLATARGYITTNGVTTCISPNDSPNPVDTVNRTNRSTNTNGVIVEEVITTTTNCQGGNCTTTTTTTDNLGNNNSQQTGESMSDFCTRNPGAAICKSENDECAKNPNLAKCKELGAPEAGPEMGTLSVPGEITSFNFGGASATCPSPVQLAHGVTFSYQPVCDALGWLKPLVLAIAGLIGAGIIIGGVRNG